MADDCSKNCCDAAASNIALNSSYATLFSSLLSIFGSCLIILTFILWKDVRRSTARIILFFLALADLGTGLSYLVSSAGFIAYQNLIKSSGPNDTNPGFNYSEFCTVTSFFTTFFPVSSFFWTVYLAIYFFIILVMKKPRWSRKLIIFFNLTAWPIPFLICIFTVSFGILGANTVNNTVNNTIGDHRNTAGWCFVSINGTKGYNYGYGTYLAWEALCAKGWELLFFCIVIISYSTIYIVHSNIVRNLLRKLKKSDDSKEYEISSSPAFSSRIDWKLFVIPIVFIALRAPGTYRYFLSMSDACWPNNDTILNDLNTSCGVSKECFDIGYNYYIIYIQAIFGPLQGFGNAVLFVFLSKVIMRRLQVLICSCCGFRNLRSREPLNSTVFSNNVEPTSSGKSTPQPITREHHNFYVKYSPNSGKKSNTASPTAGWRDSLDESGSESINSAMSAKILYGSTVVTS